MPESQRHAEVACASSICFSLFPTPIEKTHSLLSITHSNQVIINQKDAPSLVGPASSPEIYNHGNITQCHCSFFPQISRRNTHTFIPAHHQIPSTPLPFPATWICSRRKTPPRHRPLFAPSYTFEPHLPA